MLGESTYLKNVRKLVLGEADTTANGLSDSGEDLLNLVLALDVVDCHERPPFGVCRLITHFEPRGGGKVG
jgi:hypothetical protein